MTEKQAGILYPKGTILIIGDTIGVEFTIYAVVRVIKDISQKEFGRIKSKNWNSLERLQELKYLKYVESLDYDVID